MSRLISEVERVYEGISEKDHPFWCGVCLVWVPEDRTTLEKLGARTCRRHKDCNQQVVQIQERT